MATTTSSFSAFAEQIKVKNLLTVSINSEFLDMNFQIVKQCLTRLTELQTKLNNHRVDRDAINRDILERLNYVQKDIAENKDKLHEHDIKMREIQENMGVDFQRKLDQLDQKSRNFHDIDRLVKQIEALNKFVSNENFKEFQAKTGEQIGKVSKVKDDLAKYVDHENFKDFKKETEMNFKETKDNIDKVQEQTKEIEKNITAIDFKATKASTDAEQNNNMLKEINFNDMQLKLKKYKQQTEGKLNEMALKLKKKVGTTELNEVEKNIVEKLDGFLIGNQKAKANREETKEALSFLEKRINQVYQLVNNTNGQEGQQLDALFSARKWMCASCTKDLGKFEGKLGQFKPWSIFPCRELDPEKTGGYGYLNYVDKMAYKKGLTVDDTNLERLNKTFYDRSSKESSPKKMNTTRATNFMSNYGTAQKNTTSLKDQYFKNSSREKGQKGAKFFRVKNQSRRDSMNDPEKEKAKQI